MLTVVLLVLWSMSPGPTPVATGTYTNMAECEKQRAEWIKDKAARKILGAVCVTVSIPAAP